MSTVMKFQANLSWYEDGKYSTDIPCSVEMIIDCEMDGSYKILEFNYTPIKTDAD